MVEDSLDLRQGHSGQKATEQQKAAEKQAEAAGQGCNFNAGWSMIGPARWQEIPLQRANDDDKPLEPHANVDQDADDENNWQTGANLAKPKKLRNYHVTAH